MFGKVASKLVGSELNLGLLFTVSVLPDLDLMFFWFLKHRGPTHSLMFVLLVSLPVIVVYRKKAIPYIVALLSHSLIGDIYSSGIQFFWPFSTDWFFVSTISNRTGISVGLELALFVVCSLVMFVSKDFQRVLVSKTNRLFWLVPFGAVLGTFFLNFIGYYVEISVLLVIPCFFYIVLFGFAMFGLEIKGGSVVRDQKAGK